MRRRRRPSRGTSRATITRPPTGINARCAYTLHSNTNRELCVSFGIIQAVSSRHCRNGITSDTGKGSAVHVTSECKCVPSEKRARFNVLCCIIQVHFRCGLNTRTNIINWPTVSSEGNVDFECFYDNGPFPSANLRRKSKTETSFFHVNRLLMQDDNRNVVDKRDSCKSR